jgi:GntR family transcriptional repressor for pyruvate dehydrogenase complex
MSKELSGLKVTRKCLYEQVVRHIQEMILRGELQPGDRLPPERQMAEQLGVSRTVIREAVKTLQQIGLVRVLTGSGIYVSRIEPEAVSESIGLLIRQSISSFDHLTEVRRMLETEIAALAAERASPEHIEAMEETIREMEDAAALAGDRSDWIERFVEADLAFHSALVEASQNPLLPVLLEPVTEQLLDFRRLTFSGLDSVQYSLDYHREILEAVKARDASACREAMREHLKNAEKALEMVKARGVEDSRESLD